MKKISNKLKLNRRKTAFLWLLAVSGVIGTLLYFEQVEVIYVLATLALVLLLIIVAFADLERVGRGDERVNETKPGTEKIKDNQSGI